MLNRIKALFRAPAPQPNVPSASIPVMQTVDTSQVPSSMLSVLGSTMPEFTGHEFAENVNTVIMWYWDHERRVHTMHCVPRGMKFASTHFYPKKQWILRVSDLTSGMDRNVPMANIISWEPVE
jgi:hypothetical protein